jgi:TrmH family RNA methyltransferase
MLPFAQPLTSPHNPRVGFLRTLHTAKGRKAAQAFLIEGPHLLAEAAQAHIRPDLILYDPATLVDSPLNDALAAWADDGVEVLAGTPAILEKVCEAQTPQGIVAVLPLAEVAPEKLLGQRRGRLRPLVLVLDDLRDPGNVGTILRSALAADVDIVLLTPNCADVFAPKVVRAASGAHFHLPLRAVIGWEAISTYFAGAPHMQQVVVADAAGDVDYTDLDLTQRTALIIGNETHGPSAAARARATRRVRIPMFNHVESLNAAIAASVILFESVRQRRQA